MECNAAANRHSAAVRSRKGMRASVRGAALQHYHCSYTCGGPVPREARAAAARLSLVRAVRCTALGLARAGQTRCRPMAASAHTRWERNTSARLVIGAAMPCRRSTAYTATQLQVARLGLPPASCAAAARKASVLPSLVCARACPHNSMRSHTQATITTVFAR